jgi:hypothetical protein
MRTQDARLVDAAASRLAGALAEVEARRAGGIVH